MATITNFPPPDMSAQIFKAILKDLGISPFILKHWKVTIEKSYLAHNYDITAKWRNYYIRKRNYYIRKRIDMDYLESSHLDVMHHAGRLIAAELYKFNAAEDEEHMEALILLSMRPTNEPHHKQL